MEFCLYTTRSGAVYALVSVINWIVPLLITASSFVRDQRTGRVGKQFTLVAFGLYLFFWQFVMYVLQTALHLQRPDPFCPLMQTDGFPSGAAFYTGAGGTAAFMLAWLLEFSYSWLSFLWLAVWWLAPPLALVWLQFNVWQEVLVSLGLGVMASVSYFLVLWFYLRGVLPYLINSQPWSGMGCLDTWVLDDKGAERAENLRVMLERSG